EPHAVGPLERPQALMEACEVAPAVDECRYEVALSPRGAVRPLAVDAGCRIAPLLSGQEPAIQRHRALHPSAQSVPAPRAEEARTAAVRFRTSIRTSRAGSGAGGAIWRERSGAGR